MDKLTLEHVLKTVDEWLNSDDVFVREGEGGPTIPNAWVDCKKGSLLNRLCKIDTTSVNTNKQWSWVCNMCEDAAYCNSHNICLRAVT